MSMLLQSQGRLTSIANTFGECRLSTPDTTYNHLNIITDLLGNTAHLNSVAQGILCCYNLLIKVMLKQFHSSSTE